ncbi:MAG: hypothetical protein PHU85_07495, partial [Phycisphaerae bacterium]|nr:hypothetical protein [Phycisphaerae bacterium]
MAKRRLNIPLVIILSTLLAGVVAAAVIFAWKKLPKDPKPYIEAAESLEGTDPVKAAENYAKAFSYDRRVQERQTWGIRAGDIFFGIGREDQALSYYGSVSKLQTDAVLAQERLVRLTCYLAGLPQFVPNFPINPLSIWARVQERAESLIQMAPQRPYGYEAAAIARLRMNRANDRKAAMDLLKKLQELQPDNPVGYYYAARTMLTPGEGSNPDEADKLMAIAPKDASAAVLSRFHLYRTLYRAQRSATQPDESSPEDRSQKEKRQLQADLPQITDYSLMTRSEQDMLAELYKATGDIEKAGKIYREWGNDYIAALREMKEPPVREAVAAKLTELQPISAAGCVKRARLYALKGSAGADEADKAITEGLSIQPHDKSVLADCLKRQQCELSLINARLLINKCAIDSTDYGRADKELRTIADEYGGLIQGLPSYQLLAGTVAARLGDAYVAQIRLEEALRLYEQRMGGGREEAREMVETVFSLIDVYRVLNQFGQARDLLKDKLLSNPNAANDVTVRLLQSRLAADVHEFGEAERIVEALLQVKGIDKAPIYPQVLELRAQIYRQQDK